MPKPLQYTLEIHPPKGDEGDAVTFHASTPFPIPLVGDAIDRENVFGDHSNLPSPRVTRVEHSTHGTAETRVWHVTVYTKP